MFDILTVPETVTAIAASLAAVAGFGYSHSQARRARQAGLALIHAELTTGEVAEARNVIGTFRYTQGGKSVRSDRRGAVTDAAVRHVYFTILWALERADNTLSYQSASDQRRASGFIRWNLDELTRNVIWFRENHAARLNVQDDDAWTSFNRLLRSELVQVSLEAAGMKAQRQ